MKWSSQFFKPIHPGPTSSSFSLGSLHKQQCHKQAIPFYVEQFFFLYNWWKDTHANYGTAYVIPSGFTNAPPVELTKSILTQVRQQLSSLSSNIYIYIYIYIYESFCCTAASQKVEYKSSSKNSCWEEKLIKNFKNRGKPLWDAANDGRSSNTSWKALVLSKIHPQLMRDYFPSIIFICFDYCLQIMLA